MSLVLWVLTVLVTEMALMCALLRWLPVRRERWAAAMPLPSIVVVALALRYVAEASWPAALAACAGFLWGVLLALTPFRG